MVLQQAAKFYDIGPKWFISPQKEGMVRIYTALKDPSPSAGFEPAKFGSNGKHANY
jgi:hypothetical protein